MAQVLSIGDQAPDFDLSSTEDSLLMLRDEAARSSVVLFLFPDGSDEQVRAGLLTLGRHRQALAEVQARVLGVAPQKVADLKQLQRELKLPFPLLRDDRGFSAAYGIESDEDSDALQTALVVVDRQQQIAWYAQPAPRLDEVMPELLRILGKLPAPTRSYPRSVVNRLVDRWVN